MSSTGSSSRPSFARAAVARVLYALSLLSPSLFLFRSRSLHHTLGTQSHELTLLPLPRTFFLSPTDFDGKIVCVSGAASGIGKACAKVRPISPSVYPFHPSLPSHPSLPPSPPSPPWQACVPSNGFACHAMAHT
jgi:hypothetical protein